jgi:hypothetical protein
LSTHPNIAALLATAAYPTMCSGYVCPAAKYSDLKLAKRHTNALLNRISLLQDIAISRFPFTQSAKVLRPPTQKSI